MDMGDLMTLRINSGFSSFTAVLTNKDKKVLCWTHGAFTSCSTLEKEQDLIRMRSDIVQMVSECARNNGFTSIIIVFKGPLVPRLIDFNSLAENGINVTLMKDKTPVPHNGIMPPRRVRSKNL